MSVLFTLSMLFFSLSASAEDPLCADDKVPEVLSYLSSGPQGLCYKVEIDEAGRYQLKAHIDIKTDLTPDGVLLDGFLNEEKVLSSSILVKSQKLSKIPRSSGDKYSVDAVSEKKMMGLMKVKKTVSSNCEWRKTASSASHQCVIDMEKGDGRELFSAEERNTNSINCRKRDGFVRCELETTGAPKSLFKRSPRHLAVSGTVVALENFFRLGLSLDKTLSGSALQRLHKTELYKSGLETYYDQNLKKVKSREKIIVRNGICE